MPVVSDRIESAEDPAELWRVTLSDEFGGLLPAPAPDEALTGRIRGISLGEVEAFSISGTPQSMRRTSRAARRQPAEALKVCMMTRGRAVLVQGERDVVVERGQLVVYDVERPYELHFDSPWACAVMTFPRAALGLSPDDVTRTMQRPYEVRSGPGALLRGFVSSAVDEAAALADSTTALLGDAGLDLARAVLTPRGGRTTSSTIRERALRHVRLHIADPDLSVVSIAAALHMSPRTLQRQFEESGDTVRAVIRGVRLRGARRDLGDPRLADRTIAAVAARWGFTDAPAFTRAFRSEYGVSPSQARAGVTQVVA
ncbi:AraC family transcriptional regulator [Rhodococcus daqingensis]|uniref:AraC family transcriptional regulator n=1 Tax=Rhodococcus daqingensis TaxID=2479363 RepID=A0ABW2RX12_9NOCA